MSEPATAEPEPTKVRVFAFGQWPKAEAPTGADPTPLGKRLIEYLSGTYAGPLTEREAELVLQEFRAQEQYRNRLITALQQCVGKLQALAGEAIKGNGAPTRQSGLMESGRNLGLYNGYGDSAQLVANVLNSVSIQTHADNLELTRDRMAKRAEEEGGDGNG